jgi:predicted nucleotidyltransferase
MERPQKKDINPIRPMGSYFEIDKEGCIVNPASVEKIQGEWKPVLEKVINLYKELYKDNLVSVCVRGSVAKGQAIPYISDIDTFAIVKDDHEEIDRELEEEKRNAIVKEFPFASGIEMWALPLSSVKDEGALMNQSVSIFGEDVPYEKMKFSKDLALHAPHFESRHRKLLEILEQDYETEKVLKRVDWLGKGILRTAMELVIDRSGKYTRDLYPCYETFSKFYPDKEKEMRKVLELTLNPTDDKKVIQETLLPISEWLLEETKKYF